MESLQHQAQKILGSPAVKKLRTLEQSRMARVSQRHKERKDRLVKTLEHLDTAIKAECAQEATKRAEELQARSKDILEFVSLLKTPKEEE